MKHRGAAIRKKRKEKTKFKRGPTRKPKSEKVHTCNQNQSHSTLTTVVTRYCNNEEAWCGVERLEQAATIGKEKKTKQNKNKKKEIKKKG
jgi:hypothetical protein